MKLTKEQEADLLAGKPGHLPLPMAFTEIHTWFERGEAQVELRVRDPYDRGVRYEQTLCDWDTESLNDAIESGELPTPRGFGFDGDAFWHQAAYDYYTKTEIYPKEMPPVDFFAIAISYLDTPWFVWDELPEPERHSADTRNGVESTVGEVQIGDFIKDGVVRGFVTGSGTIGKISVWACEDGSGEPFFMVKDQSWVVWTKEEMEYDTYTR